MAPLYKTKNASNKGVGGTRTAALLLLLGCMLVLHIIIPQDASTSALLEDFVGKENLFWKSDQQNNAGWDPANPLAIPYGESRNLPSIRKEKNQPAGDFVDKHRAKYGGAGDKKHLGGFTKFDVHGVSPFTWSQMIQELNVRSVLDVGCGRGTSTTWFFDHGVDVLCAEGSHDAVERSFFDPFEYKNKTYALGGSKATYQVQPNLTEGLPVVEHDFSRGPWWPAKTYDAVWSVEFLEHVGVNYQFNYITAFRKAALLFVTSSRWGGWHHVEVHGDEWWITKYESYGFQFSQTLTNLVRTWAGKEKGLNGKYNYAPNGEHYNAQHVWLSMKVFINPVVAALPEHVHLLYKYRCSNSVVSNSKSNIGDELSTGTASSIKTENVILCDTVAEELKTPLELTTAMEEKWQKRIKRKLGIKDEK